MAKPKDATKVKVYLAGDNFHNFMLKIDSSTTFGDLKLLLEAKGVPTPLPKMALFKCEKGVPIGSELVAMEATLASAGLSDTYIFVKDARVKEDRVGSKRSRAKEEEKPAAAATLEAKSSSGKIPSAHRDAAHAGVAATTTASERPSKRPRARAAESAVAEPAAAAVAPAAATVAPAAAAAPEAAPRARRGKLDGLVSSPQEIAALPLGRLPALLAARPEAARAADTSGCTALHWAVSSSGASVEAVNALLKANPDGARTADVYGRLPLHWAVEKRAPLAAVVALLAGHPAAAATKDDEGRTPLAYVGAGTPEGVEAKLKARR